MQRMEKTFGREMGKALKQLRLDVTDGITDANVKDMLARLKSKKIVTPFQDAVVAQLRAVALAGSDFGREQVERDVYGVKAVQVGAWELANNAAAQWALSYGYELVRGLVDTTRRRLQVEIAEYVQNSETIGELMRRLAAGGVFGEDRAMRIAVTEVTRSFYRGSVEAWKASGVIEAKEWRTNNDELVCPQCGPLAGKVVGLDEEFEAGISGPPRHPSCRCWAVPVVE